MSAVATANTSPLPDLPRQLRIIRRFRLIMLLAVLTLWTHWFWNTLFYVWMAGLAMALLGLARVCPNCGGAFYQRGRHTPVQSRPLQQVTVRWGFNRNVFATRCLNCGVRIRAANELQS
jgi:hypothetical protein